nr:hypothetical protein [Bacteroidales bacterium]
MANCGAGFGCVLGHLRKQTPVVLASPPPHFIHSDKASSSKLFQANCGAGFGCVLGHLRKQTPVVLASLPPHFIHSDKASSSKLLQANFVSGELWRRLRLRPWSFAKANSRRPRLAATTFHPF